MGIIYRIVNKLNEKSYVGLTTRSLETRWKYHVAKALRGDNDMMICRAIRKHGTENFFIEVLGEYENDFLNEAEKLWIKELGTFGAGYNMTQGGEGTTGFVFSTESRKRMSEKAKARGVTPEAIEKTAQANRGRKLSPEILARRGPHKSHKKLSQETKDKMSAARIGKKQPPSFFEKRCRPVERLDVIGNVIEIFPSIKAAASALNVSSTTVRKYLIGKIGSPKHVLRYVEGEEIISKPLKGL